MTELDNDVLNGYVSVIFHEVTVSDTLASSGYKLYMDLHTYIHEKYVDRVRELLVPKIQKLYDDFKIIKSWEEPGFYSFTICETSCNFKDSYPHN